MLRRPAQPGPGSLARHRPSAAHRPLPTAGPPGPAPHPARSGVHAWLGRSRHPLSVLLVVLGLAAAVAAHHAIPAAALGGLHGGQHGGDHAMTAATACLGVVSAGVVIAAPLVVRLRRPRPRLRPAVRLRAVSRLLPTGPLPRARSSPLYLRHAVLRR